MIEYGHRTIEEMSRLIKGKMIVRCVIDNEGMDNKLVFYFSDGTSLRIVYDWIYEWEVTRENV